MCAVAWQNTLKPRRLRRSREDLCRRPGEERGREGLRQTAGLVQSPDALRHIQPRLGRAGGTGRRGAALLRGGDQGQPVQAGSTR